MPRSREDAIKAVCDEMDPIIAQLEADESDIASRLEQKRQRLAEKRQLKIERIEAYFDAKEIVLSPPPEAKDGG